jgi:hypothetical protein
LLAEHMREIEQRIAEVVAEQRKIRSALHDIVASKIDEYHEGKEIRPVTQAVVRGLGEDVFNGLAREASKIDKLRNEHDLHRAALLAEIEKLQRGIGGDRDADVIDLPALPMRNTRRAG